MNIPKEDYSVDKFSTDWSKTILLLFVALCWAVPVVIAAKHVVGFFTGTLSSNALPWIFVADAFSLAISWFGFYIFYTSHDFYTNQKIRQFTFQNQQSRNKYEWGGKLRIKFNGKEAKCWFIPSDFEKEPGLVSVVEFVKCNKGAKPSEVLSLAKLSGLTVTEGEN